MVDQPVRSHHALIFAACAVALGPSFKGLAQPLRLLKSGLVHPAAMRRGKTADCPKHTQEAGDCRGCYLPLGQARTSCMKWGSRHKKHETTSIIGSYSLADASSFIRTNPDHNLTSSLLGTARTCVRAVHTIDFLMGPNTQIGGGAPLKATNFEFKFRFWIFGAIFFVAFSLYAVDPVNSGIALLHALAPSVNPQSTLGRDWLRVIFACGAILVFIAAAVRTWGTAYLQAHVVHDMDLHSNRIVADGPFRYTRNPLYFANLFLAIGIGVMASRAGFLFLVLAMLLYSYRLILREETALKSRLGEPYLAYLAAVPRYWPSLAPRVPSGDATPHWGQAFLGECAFWLFGIGVLAFAATLNQTVSDSIFIAAYVAFFVSLAITKSKARSQPSEQL